MEKLFLILAMILSLSSACPDEKFCLSCRTIIGGAKICDACQYPYFVNAEGNCQLDREVDIENCISHQLKNEVRSCLLCKSGFILSDDAKSCTKCSVENCVLCSQEQKCLSCLGNIKPDQTTNSCPLDSEKIQIDNCKVAAISGEWKFCEECFEGYSHTLDANLDSCIKTKTSCRLAKKTNDDFECDICHSGFHITSLGSCKSNDFVAKKSKGLLVVSSSKENILII